MARTLKQRFWEKVRKGDACWEWTASILRSGYGSMGIAGRKTETSHRLSYEINIGKIPAGLCVLHRCDNRKCVRPDHLFLGTRADNNADRTAKGRTRNRSLHGEMNHAAKLQAADIVAIRGRYQFGNGPNLAREYGITNAMVHRIVRRLAWKHVA